MQVCSKLLTQKCFGSGLRTRRSLAQVSSSYEFGWSKTFYFQTDRTSEDRLRDKRRSSHATSETLHDNVYLASFG